MIKILLSEKEFLLYKNISLSFYSWDALELYFPYYKNLKSWDVHKQWFELNNVKKTVGIEPILTQ